MDRVEHNSRLHDYFFSREKVKPRRNSTRVGCGPVHGTRSKSLQTVYKGEGGYTSRANDNGGKWRGETSRRPT